MSQLAPARTAAVRIAAAFAIAALYGVASYFLVQYVLGSLGLVSVVFAILQPAAICAFIAFVGDPMAKRTRNFYLLVPPTSALGMILIAALFLREGIVCIVMMTPLWIGSGLAGTWLVYRARPRQSDVAEDVATFRASVLLAVPLVLIPLETSLPMPQARYDVARSVEISGEREAIWAMMQSVPDIADDEGVWTLTQSAIGVPRPLSARMDGTGVGAIRYGNWEQGIGFEEHVTHWEDGRAIGWNFVFPPSDAWDFTDSHLHPDSAMMTIERGGYDLEELSPGRFRLTLHTTYSARTRFNPYASLWGEVFLGDIQRNILAVIKLRVERAGRQP